MMHTPVSLALLMVHGNDRNPSLLHAGDYDGLLHLAHMAPVRECHLRRSRRAWQRICVTQGTHAPASSPAP